ncbi:MAG: lipid-A-disaccharide synthase [Bacteroidota bacterium]
MKLYFIAGEDSGDLHAANVMRAMQELQPGVSFRGVGGNQMEEVGQRQVAHVRDINFMGFWEVIRNLRTIRKLFQTVQADLLSWKPDAIVLVDYPGFNLRIAAFASKLGIPVLYYISPQLWAWKKGRVKKIQRFVDRLFVILPFEKEFYAKEGVEVEFVGHPLLDVIDEVGDTRREDDLIALLPGSRKQEINRLLPLMLKLPSHFPNHRFVIAGAPSQTQEFYQSLIGNQAVDLQMNATYDILQRASLAVVTSGTATLETALFGVPEVVVYKGSELSYQIGKRLVQVKFISLVNLILDRLAVRELIQHDASEANLVASLQALLEPETAAQLKADYADLQNLLGEAGASRRAAKSMLQIIAQK